MYIAFYSVTVVLNILLLGSLFRLRVRKHFPWFVACIANALISSCGELISLTISLRFYRKVYWWLEAVNVLLIIGSLRESLLRSFENSILPRRFQRLLWVSVVVVVVYSVLNAVYSPAVHNNPLVAFIIGTELALNWAVCIVAAVIVTHLRRNDKKEKIGEPEIAIIYGLNIASAGVLIWVASRYVFGIKVASITQYAPPVAYWFAVVWWLRVFSPPQFGLKDLGIDVHEALKMVRRDSEFIERIEKRRW
jgi:hypothetical protein